MYNFETTLKLVKSVVGLLGIGKSDFEAILGMLAYNCLRPPGQLGFLEFVRYDIYDLLDY